MKTLEFFRKPYLAYLVGFMLLFVSCKQYEVNEQEELNTINFDFKKLKTNIKHINSQIDKQVIHSFDDYEKELKSNNKNNTYTENDFIQAREFLAQSGCLEEGSLDTDALIEYIANQLKLKNLISSETENFIVNNLKLDNLQLYSPNTNQFINSNTNLTDFEIQLLRNIELELTKTEACDLFGTGLGIAAGVLIGASGWGLWVSGIAGGYVALAAADVCRGISQM